MSGVAIRVDKLSKLYHIGQRALVHRSLRETLTGALGAPFRRFTGRAQSPLIPTANGTGPENSRDLWALKDVSFEIKTGEIVGIIGRNGAGKSTLLKILSRITEPTTGWVEIHGRVGSLLEVGTGFHPELTGRENVFLNGAILGMQRAEIKRKFDDIVAFAEVERFIDTPVKWYSSGMYVRLAFAVAAHLEPEILVVDEVLAVGDMAFQAKCLGKMGDISREGRTVLLVSHNMPSVVNLCQRAILLQAGTKVDEGSTAEVVQRYLATASSTPGEVVWPDPELAPGNELVRLHSVRVLQDGFPGATGDVSIGNEVRIEITYRNLKDNAPLFPAIWLRDHLGTYVLASSNVKATSLTDDPWSMAPHPTGLFRSVCCFPGNFLNDLMYRVTVLICKDTRTELLHEDDIISFRVHDTGEMRKEDYNYWIGTVRPRLAWRTEYLGHAEAAVS